MERTPEGGGTVPLQPRRRGGVKREVRRPARQEERGGQRRWPPRTGWLRRWKG